jgi:hypothetical protein
MAVSGFLQLLNHLDVKGMKVLSSTPPSQHSSSQGQRQARSLLTQVTFQLLQVTRIELNKLAHMIMLLPCIWKVLSLNLGWSIDHHTEVPAVFTV